MISKLVVCGWLLFGLVACASSSTTGFRIPYGDDNSTAPGAAYAGSGMNFRKDMPHQDTVRRWDFYYKHCSINGNESFYSRTSYDCAGPSF